jgi:hypothetical protein
MSAEKLSEDPQASPVVPDRYGHDFSAGRFRWPTDDPEDGSYGVCRCGAIENTHWSVQPCPFVMNLPDGPPSDPIRQAIDWVYNRITIPKKVLRQTDPERSCGTCLLVGTDDCHEGSGCPTGSYENWQPKAPAQTIKPLRDTG